MEKIMTWLAPHHTDADAASARTPVSVRAGTSERRLLSLVSPRQLRRVLARMLDEEQFLSDHGLRSLSKEHEAAPFMFESGV